MASTRLPSSFTSAGLPSTLLLLQLIAAIGVMILSTDADSIAFIAAGAALLGGVLGAVAGGFAEYVLEKRREIVRARAGARLVRSDLLTVAHRFGLVMENREWSEVNRLSTEAWNSYREVIAMSLDGGSWEVVEGAMSDICTMEEVLALFEAQSPGADGRVLSPDTIDILLGIRTKAFDAYNVLSFLAQGPEAEPPEIAQTEQPPMETKTE
jgi:hypothetical protein